MLGFSQEKKNKMVYYYENKPYYILHDTVMKVDEDEIPCIVYKSLYTKERMVEVRERKDFFTNFKTIDKRDV